MTKKIYKQKCFSLLITKNLNWEILTKNLVIFKRRDGVKDENFWYDGVSLKNLIFKGVVHEKSIYRKGNCLKRGRGLEQIAELRGGWQKSRGRKGRYHYAIFHFFILGMMVKALGSQSGKMSSKPLTGFMFSSAFHPRSIALA